METVQALSRLAQTVSSLSSMMYSIRSQKWACLVLLTGLSKTFAGALPDEFFYPDEFSVDSQLLAVAPDGSDFFTNYPPVDVEADLYADLGPYDSYADSGPYDLFASSDVSVPFGSEFEIAAAGECYYGEVLGDVVHAAPSCTGGHPGCSAPGGLAVACKTVSGA